MIILMKPEHPPDTLPISPASRLTGITRISPTARITRLSES
jgi:hypothetical protein